MLLKAADRSINSVVNTNLLIVLEDVDMPSVMV